MGGDGGDDGDDSSGGKEFEARERGDDGDDDSDDGAASENTHSSRSSRSLLIRRTGKGGGGRRIWIPGRVPLRVRECARQRPRNMVVPKVAQKASAGCF